LYSTVPRIQNVTVIGSGQMGGGIAQVSAENGFKVTLIDQHEDVLNKNKAVIKKSLDRVAKKKNLGQDYVTDVMSKITFSTDTMSAVKESDLVVEAIVENLEIKQNLFAAMEANAKETTILASNTSSLNIQDIAEKCTRKENIAGLHFFNPVPVMKLVEIVSTSATDSATTDALRVYSNAIKKRSVMCKDTPGFIVNRLLVPYLFEACAMYERGDASMSDIDAAMKLGAGYPMGPFELADYVGLDTMKFIMDGWLKKYPHVENFKASELINKLVEQGRYGLKVKKGFYDY